MAQFEFETMGLDGVIRSEADFQAERGISRESAATPRARSLGPLVRARGLRDDAADTWNSNQSLL